MFANLIKCSLRPSLQALVIATAFVSCSDDEYTGQPSWLGESVYEELQSQGNYTTMLRLIDDLGLKEQMSHTGSLTLFAADDATWNQWLNTNTWGVRSYDALSTSQKKQLLYSQEINNAYLVELMSSVEATSGQGLPLKGHCMRRTNSSSVFDDVTTQHWQEMPQTDCWRYYRENQKDIILFKDGQMMSGTTTSNLSQPMIHFLPSFMETQGFTDEDITLLTNGKVTSVQDAFVGGHLITERDITCKNGYIHKMDGVIEPMPNMAEILRRHTVTSQWSQLVDRFSAPYYDQQKTNELARLTGEAIDSVFTLRYFARSANEYLPREQSQNKETGDHVSATLAFDPGWNQYVDENSADLHYNAGVMLVPSNDALQQWWDNDGRALQDMYGSWEGVPEVVLAPLINVNMLSSLISSVPSKFPTIVNDAKTALGITMADVDSCFIGCNGVVMVTNRVFAPMEYSSVTFPALVHQDIMGTIYHIIDEYNFKPYLNSMDSRYSVLLPTDNAMLSYIDPCNYGENTMTLLEVRYDQATATLTADAYDCTVSDQGSVEKGLLQRKGLSSTTLRNRMTDLINQLIVVGDIEDGHTVYKTKNGTPLVVRGGGGQSDMTILGGWQIEHGHPTEVANIYDQSKTGNGKAYVISGNIPQSASRSVYETLRGHEEYAEFLKLLQGSEHLSADDQLLLSQQKIGSNTYSCSNSSDNFNVSLFGNYNYNVYVPTNESIQQLISEGYLPTWEDYDAAFEAAEGEEDALCRAIKNRILNFVKYHIQDNAVAINMAPETDSEGNQIYNNNYESMMLNTTTNRYYTLGVDFGADHLTVTDLCRNERHVVKTDGLYNNICREYWIEGTTAGVGKSLYASADAIVHLIDGPLFYDKSQYETKWK